MNEEMKKLGCKEDLKGGECSKGRRMNGAGGVNGMWGKEGGER